MAFDRRENGSFVGMEMVTIINVLHNSILKELFTIQAFFDGCIPRVSKILRS